MWSPTQETESELDGSSDGLSTGPVEKLEFETEFTDEPSGIEPSPSVRERVVDGLAPLATGPIRYTHLQFAPFPYAEENEQVLLGRHLIEMVSRVVVVFGAFVAGVLAAQAAPQLFVAHPLFGLPTGVFGTVAVVGAAVAFGVLHAVSHTISFIWPGLYTNEREALLAGGSGVALAILVVFPVAWAVWFVTNPLIQVVVYGLQQVTPRGLSLWVNKKAIAVNRILTDDHKLDFAAAPTLEAGTHEYTLDSPATHYFAVELDRDERLTATVAVDVFTANTPTLTVYDSDRWQLEEKAIGKYEDEVTVSAVAEKSGHHYVTVSHEFGGQLDYRLRIDTDDD